MAASADRYPVVILSNGGLFPVIARTERQQRARDRGQKKQPAHLYTSCWPVNHPPSASALRFARRDGRLTWLLPIVCRHTTARQPRCVRQRVSALPVHEHIGKRQPRQRIAAWIDLFNDDWITPRKSSSSDGPTTNARATSCAARVTGWTCMLAGGAAKATTALTAMMTSDSRHQGRSGRAS